MTKEKTKGGNINAKSFITATIIIFVLMVLTYVLTHIIPSGEYSRIIDADGNAKIDPSTFTTVEGGIPFWKWILSPFLVLGSDGSMTIIAILIFLLVIGGTFACLEKCGLIKYILAKITNRFGKSRYKLMAVVVLFFMALGSLVGSFEECVPLVPIVVALSVALGWDILTGISMSILATGCGFASGVLNPFTVGTAQELAGLPMFSGVWLRLLSFALIYGLLLLFIYKHAKKTQKPLDIDALKGSYVKDKKLDKATIWFVSALGFGILAIILSGFISFLQGYAMIIVAVMFLVIGIACPIVAGLDGKTHAKTFLNGVLSLLPAVLMILMASSIKYTMEEAKILDTILNYVSGIAGSLPKWSIILFIYLIVLIMNFFIPSGSAKAFLLIPLIMPIAEMFGISLQLCIVAFAFGDGFSNVVYPTNPVLLISLGISDTGYGKWVKHTWKFQLLNLILTSGILLLGYAVGF